MLVMGIARKAKPFVMSGVVIAEYELPGAVHILVNVGQAVNSNLNVYEFSQMEKGAINKVNLTAYKTFMSARLIIRSLDDWTTEQASRMSRRCWK